LALARAFIIQENYCPSLVFGQSETIILLKKQAPHTPEIRKNQQKETEEQEEQGNGSQKREPRKRPQGLGGTRF